MFKFILIVNLITLSLSSAQAMGKKMPHETDDEYKSTELAPDSYCKNLKFYAQNAKWSLTTPNPEITQLVVDKSRRLLHALSQDKVVRSYKVALGRGGPVGPKRKTGDNKTPEGRYFIEYKNSASDYHLSLRVSYPNAEDIAWARENNVDPGGDIMIHGLPNSAIKRAFINHPKDWTKGCVAVTNNEIEQLFEHVDSGTPIELCK